MEEESLNGGYGRRSLSGRGITVISISDSEDGVLFLDFLRKRIPDVELAFSSFPQDSCPGFQIPALGLTFRGKGGEGEVSLLADVLFSEKTGPLFAAGMEEKTGLRLFISSHCPHCPGALRLALGFLENAGIDLEVVNVDHCPELAEIWHVMAVPVLMFRGEEEGFRWTGNFRRKDVEKALLERTPETLGEESLINILESGDAQRLVTMMQAGGRVFPALYGLLTHEKWTVRLGAMVVAETLLSLPSDLGEILLEGLWQRRESMEPSVQGDMFYLMGLGNPHVWFSRLSPLLPHVEGPVLEALGEALEDLEERM